MSPPSTTATAAQRAEAQQIFTGVRDSMTSLSSDEPLAPDTPAPPPGMTRSGQAHHLPAVTAPTTTTTNNNNNHNRPSLRQLWNLTMNDDLSSPEVQQESGVKLSWFAWRLALWVSMLMCAGVVIAGSYILGAHPETCYPAMYKWLLGTVILDSLQLVNGVAMQILLPSVYDSPDRVYQRVGNATRAFIVTRLTVLAFVVWQVVGVVFLGMPRVTDDECSALLPDGVSDQVMDFSRMLLAVHIFGLLGVSLVMMCGPCLFLFVYADESAAEMAVTDFFESSNRNGASNSVIEALPTRIYDPEMAMGPPTTSKHGNHSGDKHGHGHHAHKPLAMMQTGGGGPRQVSVPTTCVVCQSDFEKGEQCTSLPCSHLFHSACIKPWLANNAICPQCRVSAVQAPQSRSADKAAAAGSSSPAGSESSLSHI